MISVTWDAAVVHWLTFGSSADAERELSESTETFMSIPLVPSSASTNLDRDGKLGIKPTPRRGLKEPFRAPPSNAGAVDVSQDRIGVVTQAASLKIRL
jgi:hypothetical protein